MICNYKIINDDTKEILIAVGDDKDWFIAEGFTLEGEIEEGFNGKYYLKGYAPKNPAPTAEEIQKQLTDAVQNYMDTTVQARGYDNINSACTYANSTDHIFAAEGVACVKWRDAVWRKCYDMLAEVKAGTRAIPTAEEVIAELPALEW